MLGVSTPKGPCTKTDAEAWRNEVDEEDEEEESNVSIPPERHPVMLAKPILQAAVSSISKSKYSTEVSGDEESSPMDTPSIETRRFFILSLQQLPRFQIRMRRT
jgi:hypothetical protein